MKRLLAVMISLTFLVSAAYAAAPPKGKKQKKQVTPQVHSMDLKTEKLPPKYEGNSPVQIWTELNAAMKPEGYKKGEFETSGDYAARIEKLTAKIDTTYSGVYPFSIKVRNYYNADNSELSSRFNYNVVVYNDAIEKKLKGMPGTQVRAIEVWTGGKKKGQYIGRTTFNVKAKVTELEIETISLAFNTDDRNPIAEMPADKAREAKEWGRVLFLAKFVDPYIGQYKKHSPATLDDPSEAIFIHKYIAVKLVEVWLYNYKTGEIYNKIRID